jgi:chromosome segregation ATPase
MKATQARLPYTLPTPAQARGKLREARANEANTRNVLSGLKEHLKAAKSEAEAASAELVEAERTLLDAADDSPESLAAEAEQGRAWKRLRTAETGLENLQSTIRAADAEHAESARLLRAAREDLEAVRVGRRKR